METIEVGNIYEGKNRMKNKNESSTHSTRNYST